MSERAEGVIEGRVMAVNLIIKNLEKDEYDNGGVYACRVLNENIRRLRKQLTKAPTP